MSNVTGTVTVNETTATGTVTVDETVVAGTVTITSPVITGTYGPVSQPGEDGAPGQDGAPGVGVPVGGTTGQQLAKATDDDYDTEWVDAAAGGGGGVQKINTDLLAPNTTPVATGLIMEIPPNEAGLMDLTVMYEASANDDARFHFLTDAGSLSINHLTVNDPTRTPIEERRISANSISSPGFGRVFVQVYLNIKFMGKAGASGATIQVYFSKDVASSNLDASLKYAILETKV